MGITAVVAQRWAVSVGWATPHAPESTCLPLQRQIVIFAAKRLCGVMQNGRKLMQKCNYCALKCENLTVDCCVVKAPLWVRAWISFSTHAYMKKSTNFCCAKSSEGIVGYSSKISNYIWPRVMGSILQR